jgi:hypothetical protein
MHLLFYGTLEEFNMDPRLISLPPIDPDFKPVCTCAYIVPRSVGLQFQKLKEISILVDIEIIEEDYSLGGDSFSPTFTIPKKNGTIREVTHFRILNLLWERRISSISFVDLI